MKKIIILLTVFCSFSQVNAQVKSALWVMFGGEMRQGNYSEVNAFFKADTYNMFNRTTFRMEMIDPKAMNMSIDATGLITYSKDNFGESDNTFRKVWDRPALRWSMYKLKGNQDKNTRFGIGGQIHIRKFGVGNDFGKTVGVNNNVHKAGPLTARMRFGLGPNFNLVHQFDKRIYTRITLYADYEPGSKTNGINIYPEAVVIANYKLIGIMANVGYRYSYFIGDPNTGTYLLEPTKSANAMTLFYGLGAGINLEKWL